VSINTCENCGASASDLAECPSCGAFTGDIAQSVKTAGGKRRLVPILLALFGLSLTIPVGRKAMTAYNVRVSENHAKRDSAERAEADMRRYEEQRIMFARADSVLKAVPRSRISKIDTYQLSADLTIVASRSDSAAQRWIKSAKSELKRRSAKKDRQRAKNAGH
jgi:hypothetical protein